MNHLSNPARSLAIAAVFLTITVGVAGCGDSDDAISVADASTCDELISATLPLMDDFVDDQLDELGELTIAEMTEENTGAVADDYEERVTEATAKQEELGCGADFLDEAGCEVAGDKEAQGPAGEEFLADINADC